MEAEPDPATHPHLRDPGQPQVAATKSAAARPRRHRVSSRRKSGRCSRTSATSATRRRRRKSRAGSCSTRARGSAAAATTGRRWCRAISRRACSSRRSVTRTRISRCRRKSRAGSCPDEVIKDFEKWVQMGAPDPREGAAKVDDEAGYVGGGEGLVGVAAGEKSARAAGERRRVAEERHRPLPPRRAGGEGAEAGGRCGQAHAAAARHFRPHRPAAEHPGHRRVSQGQLARCLQQGRGPPARLPAVRRKMGPPLARCGAVCGEHGQGHQPRFPQCLALSRLRHRGVQQGQAVRPVPARANRRRSPPGQGRQATRRATRRHRLSGAWAPRA